MASSDQYKRQIMSDLEKGNTESLEPVANAPEQDYQNFDDFAQRSSRDERKQLFGRSFHHENISPGELEPELQKAIAQIKPNERENVAREFLKQLKQKGISDRDLEKQLSLSTHHPSRMTADDVSKLAGYTYHNHPHVFQDVLAEQPAIVKFLSNPLVGAALGAIATKWLGSHRHS
ncbi:MAG: hypothetical protein ICV78_15155 [Tolypothrix sp. Co-bin9]|jgi:hypothetical protein|nr:hypothetical protein [Tolypothrix sp. Co-bin9]